MKALRMITLTVLILSLLALCVGAQEISAANSENATGKSDVGPAGLIESSVYAFSAQSGVALDDMSGGTSLLLGSNLDNDSSAPAPIGFLFRFDGANFTDFGVNANGLARLGGQVTTTSTLNALNSVANAPKIMPFWDDLCIGVGGKVHYKTTGSFPNRKLVVEWQDMKITRAGACDGTGGGTFQMWLFEGTGVVQFVYGGGMTASANGGYSVGLQSGAATNFASVTTATNSVSYSAANNTQMDAIPAGTSYLFSPAIPSAATGGSVLPLRQTSLQLNWTDNASGEDGYVVWRSTDNVNFSLVGQLPANATSFTDSGLTPSTQYFYSVSAMATGAFSPGLTFSPTTAVPGSVSSTAAGGLWSAPSTWAGGVVPDGADAVTIPSGATVIIDTDALAGSVKIGSVGSLAEGKGASVEGGSPAALRFADTGPFSLTVAGSVTIGGNDSFTTGSGNVTTHVLTVSGDLINNGTLDLSTNNNQAGAGIVFNGNSSNTFGGTGAVTNIRTITVDKGPTNANILELSTASFTVQGSASQNSGSAYLTLNQGTFKISGTFFGSHTTFNVAAYNIGAAAGVWLNNPNYTVVALDDMTFVTGLLRISAGTWNAGGAATQPMTLFQGSTVTIEGGSLNTAGGLSGATTYNQSGGTVTTCRIATTSSASSVCFGINGAVTMSGGEIVIQNPCARNLGGPRDYGVNVGSGPAAMAAITGTTLRFGNALTSVVSTFKAGGLLPNVVIDTTAGGHKLILDSPQEGTTTRNINIPAGATLEFSRHNMMGDTFINNGILNAFFQGYLAIDDGVGLADINYIGTGTMTGYLTTISIHGHSFTLDPSAGNLRTINITVISASIINAARITLGINDTQISIVDVRDGATFDSAPDFNIGSGGEKVIYSGTGAFTTGPEIKPDRVVREFEVNVTGSVTIAGGDLALTHFFRMVKGVIVTGSNVLTLRTGLLPLRGSGYVDGHLRRQVTSNANYAFDVGQNGYSPVIVEVASGSGGGYLTVTPIDTTLPGLLPATSLSRYWHLEEEGSITSRLSFYYTAGDIRGNPNTYKLWFANGGAPAVVPGFLYQAPTGMQSPFGITDYTGDWGVGNDLDPGPVSISGRVTTSSGNPIRNASVTISGGSLSAPVRVFTGSLGTYFFSGLQAGEVYTVQVSAKRYRFPAGGSQQVTPFGNVANADFAANPQEEF